MTEHIDIPQSEHIEPTIDGDALDEWLAGATIAKRSVPIYGKPGLIAEIQELERQAAKVEQLEAEEALGDDEAEEIQARFDELHQEYIDSKSTWTVRALGDDDFERLGVELAAAVGEKPVVPVEPTQPAPLPAKRTATQVGKHQAAMAEYEAKKASYDADVEAFEKAYAHWITERNLRQVVAAVVKIDFADGRSVDSIDLDRLRTLSKILGDRQILALLAAIRAAMSEEPEISAPFSRRSSQDETT